MSGCGLVVIIMYVRSFIVTLARVPKQAMNRKLSTLIPHYTLVMAVGAAQKPSNRCQTKHCIAKVVTVILMRCGRVEGVPGELCLEKHHFLRNLPMGKTTPLVKI